MLEHLAVVMSVVRFTMSEYKRLMTDIIDYLEKDTSFWDNLALQLLVSRLREISNYSRTPQARRMMHVVLRNMTEELEDVMDKRMENREYIQRGKTPLALNTNCRECFNLRIREWSIGTEKCKTHEREYIWENYND